MKKPQTFAIILTALSSVSIWNAFANTPIITLTVATLAIGYVISAGMIFPGPQLALVLPVYGGCSILFGLFAGFQAWRIMVKIIDWLDSVLTTFFIWIQI